MTNKTLRIGDLNPDLPVGSWVLVLGGVSRVGNRRARRFSIQAAISGKKVVWFDGFEEVWEDSAKGRVDLPSDTPDEAIFVFGYRDQEQRFFLNRLANAVPRAVFAPGSWAAKQLGRSSNESLAHFGRRIRRITRKVGEALRSKFLGKLAAAFRGRAGYKIVRTQLVQLARSTTPSAIIFCDDFALTTAWHAARIWPDAPVSSELPS